MFVGHYAPALAAAAFPKSPRLGTLFVAAQLVDLAFFAFVLTGVEHMRIVPGITAMNPMDLYDMPYTHSLLGSALWAAGFGLLVLGLTRSRPAALIAAAVVLSHWLLDLLVHRPDLTLAGAPPRLGLGLWNLPAVEMTLEIAFVVSGFAIYLLRTRSLNAQGRFGWIALAALLVLFQAMDWFGAKPETLEPAQPLTALFAYGAAALVAWWVGRNREPLPLSREKPALL